MKNNRIRSAAMLVASAITVTALAGCSPAADDGPVTLHWWAPNLQTSLEKDQTYYEELLAPFTEETGIEVDIEVNAWGDYYNKILGAIGSGEGPDLISTGTTWVSTLTDSGAFLQFDDASLDEVGGGDQYVPTAYDAAGGSNDGGPSMIPWVTGVTQMWYNPAMFEAAGITTPPATWSEFVDAAKKLTVDTDGDGQIDQWGFGFPAGFAVELSHVIFAYGEQNGASFFDEEGNPALGSEEMVDAAEQLVNLMTVDKVLSPSDVEAQAMTDTYQDFINGRIAMLFSPGANTAFDDAGFTDYDLAQMPLLEPLPGRPVTTHITGVNLGVFGETEHQEETLELVKFLSSTETQTKMATDLPGILPANLAVYDSPDLQSSKVFEVSGQILQDTAAGFPINILTGQAETLIGDAMKELFAKAATSGSVSRADIQDVLSNANSQLEAAQ